jgi:proteasome assembly chaperone (PAC2) family protein
VADRRKNGACSRLAAVWPGMGHVALTAGFYLMSRLHMQEEDPPATGDLFDLEHVDVQNGLVRAGHIPVSHLFAHRDPRKRADLGLMIGEAQPPLHKMEYCRRILDQAQALGVAQVYTFAAMAVDLHPRDPSRVYGVATHREGLDALRRLDIEILEAGRISGLNGVFLAAAAERGIPGLCLLGAMPAFAVQVPYPKASHAVLQAFGRLIGLEVDLRELEEYGRSIEEQLTAGLEKIRTAIQSETDTSDEDLLGDSGSEPELAMAAGPTEIDRGRVESLFEQALRDRAKAFELKRELDRLGVFREYENRFLDLFRRRAQ